MPAFLANSAAGCPHHHTRTHKILHEEPLPEVSEATRYNLMNTPRLALGTLKYSPCASPMSVATAYCNECSASVEFILTLQEAVLEVSMQNEALAARVAELEAELNSMSD
eukprot:CAMPEP_0204913320 /NCGR_PEP_ID=MMETSP1397-20131031/11238_1 /ASSEMBLY_ACC=CAM_ASM_000891 /TAXON_ID=49980 /ORGANISM="Climacostomum Climacostomum virens, Strain Stock W-24" /LENGTH=109 /DNA_ID=CAMNT_0052084531 /DNA_START=695 /DNA_END=1024 /DNA_ORIENTATION=-